MYFIITTVFIINYTYSKCLLSLLRKFKRNAKDLSKNKISSIFLYIEKPKMLAKNLITISTFCSAVSHPSC